MNKRDEQRRETRERIIAAAVQSLIENGFAATTALGVQNSTGISRGALLHHFPTSESLSAAAVHRLVEINLEAIREELQVTDSDLDPVRRGVTALYRASCRAPFAAELELWSAARADERLRSALYAAERAALKPLHDMIDEIFGPTVTCRPGYAALVRITVQLLRGLTISRSLRRHHDFDDVVRDWTAIMQAVLDNPEPVLPPT